MGNPCIQDLNDNLFWGCFCVQWYIFLNNTKCNDRELNELIYKKKQPYMSLVFAAIFQLF